MTNPCGGGEGRGDAAAAYHSIHEKSSGFEHFFSQEKKEKEKGRLPKREEAINQE